MSNDLHRLLHDLADDMTDTNYTALRGRVDTTSRRIGRRNAFAAVAAGLVAVAAVAGGGYALASRPTPGPGPTGTGEPSPTVSPTAAASPTPAAIPTAVPGTLVYLTARAGQPIIMTTVIDGVAHQTSFGTATASNELVPLVPSPDATRLATIESPDPGSVRPGDLVVIEAGGARHTLATGVHWGGGNAPVWMPDGRHIAVSLEGLPLNNSWQVIDVATGAKAGTPPMAEYGTYLTWSPNGQWRAYGSSTNVFVTAPDGSGEVKRSVASLPECHETAGCPTSVQAVSDDGRYVALGHMNSDPNHVDEAHLVLDMQTGSLITLPAPNGSVNKVWFRPDGGMVVRTSTNDGRYTFILLRSDGNTIATFPDTQEQFSSGRHLVAYHP